MFLLGLFLFLAGCSFVSQPKMIEKPLIMKCEVPEVPKAELEPVPENGTYPEKLKTILNNYFKLEKENALLRSALEVCK